MLSICLPYDHPIASKSDFFMRNNGNHRWEDRGWNLGLQRRLAHEGGEKIARPDLNF